MKATVSDGRTFPFFQVENAVIDHYGTVLGPYGLAVYIAIARHVNHKTGVAFPSMATIAAETGMKRNRVVRAVKQLRDLGLIQIRARKRDDGGQTSNEYELVNVAPLVPPQTPEPEASAATTAPPCISGIHPPVFQKYTPCIPEIHEQDELNQTKLNHTNTKATGAATPPPGASAKPPDLPALDAPITGHAAMKNVLLAALRVAPQDVTCWGEYERASKLLRGRGATRREVEGAVRWCARHFTQFGPVAVAKHLADYRAEQAQVYANGLTHAEADILAAEVAAEYAQIDADALAAFERIKGGTHEPVTA